MKVLYESQELWSLVENGLVEPEDQSALTQAQLTELKDNKKKDKKALFFIFQAVDLVIFESISSANSAKEAWDTLYAAYKGEDKIKLVRLQTLRCEFDSLRMKDSESVEEFFNRVIALVNQMKVNGEAMENQKFVE
ncbi:UBN2 domain-containing protein [Cephalotus follicularis]|uniref:UBN2 domain-containing protein n=1 Tax=Cephalotus follicularis TaxID=3775 RepID=A0A1Q3B1F2_CEPFO|nr:UBN2 domain-containing protein [Cephalotus follicularis]